MVRPTKLNDYIISEVRSCMELGMSYAATAGSINVSSETFNNWMNWGKAGIKDPIYSRFYAAVREGESKLMYDCLIKLKKSAETGNIESVKWLLERRFNEFSKQSALNVRAHTESVSVNLIAPLDEDQNAKIRAGILAKLQRKPALPLQEGEE